MIIPLIIEFVNTMFSIIIKKYINMLRISSVFVFLNVLLLVIYRIFMFLCI
jgi:hypothetical protein